MASQEQIKKIRENFKKKRNLWEIKCESFDKFEDAYDYSRSMFEDIDAAFTKEYKEKYGFQNLMISVGTQHPYDVSIFYSKKRGVAKNARR